MGRPVVITWARSNPLLSLHPTQPPSNVAIKRSLVDTIKTTKQGLVYKCFLLVGDGVFDVLHLKSNGRVCENMDWNCWMTNLNSDLKFGLKLETLDSKFRFENIKKIPPSWCDSVKFDFSSVWHFAATSALLLTLSDVPPDEDRGDSLGWLEKEIVFF